MENWMVSPRYDMLSLRQGKIGPVDVFEDAIQGWILDYAARLATSEDKGAGMALMLLVAAYPETIECYLTGEDSKSQSKRFFTKGMKRVFSEVADVPDDALASVYDDVRNGLYHGSMLKGSVILRPEGEPISYSSDERVFRINPFAFFSRVQEHFSAYVRCLRMGKPKDAEIANFYRYWEARHAVSSQLSPTTTATTLFTSEIATGTAAPVSLIDVVRGLE